MTNGSSREGWTYVYNRHPGKAKRVRGGDYLRSKVPFGDAGTQEVAQEEAKTIPVRLAIRKRPKLVAATGYF